MQNRPTIPGACSRRLPILALSSLLAIAPSAFISQIASARAVDNWGLDGANGTLQVYGSLTESTCQLEMNSLRQDIQLGNVVTARLLQPGDRGTPVTFQLQLKDCVRGPSAARDTRTGTLSWSSMQPAISVYFFGSSDDDLPDYIQVKGTGGLALRLTDSLGRLLPLNQRSRPLLLSPGNDQLIYTVTPVRTPAPLSAGAFQASVEFRIIYD